MVLVDWNAIVETSKPFMLPVERAALEKMPRVKA